jgi:hypothetical protein
MNNNNNNIYIYIYIVPKTTTCSMNDERKCIVECLMKIHEQPLNKLLGGIDGTFAMQPIF